MLSPASVCLVVAVGLTQDLTLILSTKKHQTKQNKKPKNNKNSSTANVSGEVFIVENIACVRVGSEYFQSIRVRVLSTSEVLEYEYEYFSPFYKSTRVRVQSTQNVLMNTLMSTFRY